MLRALALNVALIGVVGCDVAPNKSSRAASPSANPSGTAATHPPEPFGGGPLPDAPLDQFCGPHASEPCPTLPEHLAALRSKECLAQPPPKLTPCDAYGVVDVDYGIVGYSRYFDASGKLVGAIAHVYEYGRTQRYGAIPACAMGTAKPLCDATPPQPSAK